MKILDIGCGPGTITADLAKLVPEGHVTAVDHAPGILDRARAVAAERGLDSVDFGVADVHALDFPDDTFCVVHAHQVLQHVGDPVQALREMYRVTKPGGFIAARDADYSAMAWYPEVPGLTDWQDLYLRVARANGGEPAAGRRLKSWALTAWHQGHHGDVGHLDLRHRGRAGVVGRNCGPIAPRPRRTRSAPRRADTRPPRSSGPFPRRGGVGAAGGRLVLRPARRDPLP